MSGAAPTAVYSLCLLASATCAALLLRAFFQNRSKLILFTAIGFVFLAINNLFLVADLVLFPEVDLWLWRQAALVAAVAVLLYGFAFEVEE